MAKAVLMGELDVFWMQLDDDKLDEMQLCEDEIA